MSSRLSGVIDSTPSARFRQYVVEVVRAGKPAAHADDGDRLERWSRPRAVPAGHRPSVRDRSGGRDPRVGPRGAARRDRSSAVCRRTATSGSYVPASSRSVTTQKTHSSSGSSSRPSGSIVDVRGERRPDAVRAPHVAHVAANASQLVARVRDRQRRGRGTAERACEGELERLRVARPVDALEHAGEELLFGSTRSSVRPSSRSKYRRPSSLRYSGSRR